MSIGRAAVRSPLSSLAGEGDKGGEGNTARLPVHACAGENSPYCRDSVPNRCTLISPVHGGGTPSPRAGRVGVGGDV